jgi:phage terminase large subunit-like protein
MDRIQALASLSGADRSARMSLCEQTALMPPIRRQAFLSTLSKDQRRLLCDWEGEARPGQRPPEGKWRIWMIMAGRGFGKTRAGAEWVLGLAETPGLLIALVGPTDDEARAVMVEGPAGILACARDFGPAERPKWEPSNMRLVWPNGTLAFVHSGANPESLRGPECDYAWCDELAKWPRSQASWDNLMFVLRRGRLPRVLVTTTPRPTPLIRRLATRPGVVITRGRTEHAALLSESVVEELRLDFGGTNFGRQELDGELILDMEGSLWPRDLTEASRAALPLPDWRRVVVGIDPPASAQGVCGIVVCARGVDDRGYVLADASVAGLRPEGWARAAASAARAWNADRVVAEGNQGGAMVESVLRGADVALPVRIVHASQGKSARAEPVAALFEGGRAKFVGGFPELEDQLAGMIAGGGYEGPGRSPDRADAMVWAMTELMLGKKRAEPRIRQL